MLVSIRRSLRGLALATLALAALTTAVQAEVKLPNIFGNHMVLQQKQKNKVWGTATAGEAVTVTIGGQSHKTTADAKGQWSVMLDPLALGDPLTLTVNNIKFEDVLVGEVWVCSGQSNMQWGVNSSTDPDLENLAAKYPKIRMINFPQVGTQDPIWSHDRQWEVCAPGKIGHWSAVGYFFARQLHQTLDVPVGMINNAWGGSACEAWINRDVLAADEKYKPLMDRWAGMEKTYADLKAKGNDLTEDEKKQLNGLQGPMGGNSRPANIYNGVLKSHLGYGIKGAIWYQGESNAGRAYQYRDLFPLMISNWRKEWNQGDFPFYWVQLADFTNEAKEPGESDWAELREAQTMTMARLPNTGEAVIIDIGEGKDIHPMNKVDVGRRLARWALAKDYGVNIAHHSPQYKSMAKDGNKIVLTFDYVDRGWRPFDVPTPRGFAICGADKKWVYAQATIQQNGTIAVSAEGIADPVAVRYGWANNPVVNMFNGAGLPLTPFRTDDFPGVTINNK
ncbi:MAG: sialate O-acetylesterase [Planctomycetota bacterium]|nr:sialate O-acetylesterase [Planctomycetota bacterium]